MTTPVKKAIEQLTLFETVPTKAIELLIANKAESTPLLLDIVKNTLKTYKKKDANNEDYRIALHILSEFKEAQAFPLVMQIAALPSDDLDTLLGDYIISELPRWMVSTFAGDIQPLKTLIENESVYTLSRHAALSSLVGLASLGKVPKETIVTYFKQLLNDDITHDQEFSAFLVLNASSLDPKALYADIKNLFKAGHVEEQIIDLNYIDEIIAGETTHYLGNQADLLITDALESIASHENTPFDEAVHDICCGDHDDDNHSVIP